MQGASERVDIMDPTADQTSKATDALERIARELTGENGCCQLFDPDGRCCMTDRARSVLATVLHEIDCCGFKSGMYTGVLDVFAKKNGLTFEPAPRTV